MVILEILEFRNALKSTQKFRFPILSKCFKDKLKQDTLLLLSHRYFFLLSLLKLRFGGKMDFFNPHWKVFEKAKLRPEKRFEANVLQFFQVKIARICPEN